MSQLKRISSLLIEDLILYGRFFWEQFFRFKEFLMTPKKTRQKHHSLEALMRYARRLGFGEIHQKTDAASGLHAIVAIHSTKLGPAIGGSRLYEYASTGQALKDVLRLSYMMTLKAAISNLPHGGAKAVIIKPKVIKDRRKLIEAYGDFVHELNGRYIAAIDVNTSTEDMDIIAERTPYVIGASRFGKLASDPSAHTALGVLKSIEAAAHFKTNKNSLDGLRVAIQGAGHVGYYLGKLLHERGAQLTVTDPRKEAVDRFVKELNAKAVSLDEIYDVPCDIFSPCAMGGSINADTLKRIQASMIIGSANNQLAHHEISKMIDQKGIIYVPDFLANSGGLINAAMVYDYQDTRLADEQINKLYDTVLVLLERSKQDNRSTIAIAEKMAREKLDGQ